MTFLLALFVFFMVIILATILNRQISIIPSALCQIILGAVVSFLPLHLSFDFDPNLFLICIIAPLLFSDAWHASPREMWKYKTPIILMALGLVFTTVLLIGLTLHVLIPSMPLAVSFALAAILSPTDNVAMKSITKGLSLPKGMMPVLEGESLLNDAAGIVSFKVALAAALTGVFTIHGAIVNFLFISFGGIIVGTILGYMILKLRLVLHKYEFEEVPMIVLIQILTPFVVYYISEELHVSGILAVVAAGLIHALEKDRLRRTTPNLQIVSTNTWTFFGYTLNGFVFVLLGFLLPNVFRNLFKEDNYSQVILMTFLIAFLLFMIRFLWIFSLYRWFGKEGTNPFIKIKSSKVQVRLDPMLSEKFSRLRYAFIGATCGINGTITLTIALSIPYQLSNGAPFPLRNTILFIAAGVILLSLLFAVITLPLMLKRPNESQKGKMTFHEANRLMLQRTISLLNQKQTEDNKLALNHVVKDIREQLLYTEQGIKHSQTAKRIKKLYFLSYQAEQDKLLALAREKKISPDLQEAYIVYLQKREQFEQLPDFYRFWLNIRYFFKKRKAIRNIDQEDKIDINDDLGIYKHFRDTQKTVLNAALDAIKKHQTQANQKEAEFIIQKYERDIKLLQLTSEQEDRFNRQFHNILISVIRMERDIVQDMLDNEEITPEIGLELRKNINFDEIQIANHTSADES
ncbi:Na+/H+ antiporter [Terrilactibacillus laevilacticus]|uniref:Na+/H+ antiporter n=1 Tax=Terrilactibacillus laevilacticus TaxID=1380157 RepID=A0ABW5PMN1_9BACI|nr:Na+/H+ antiporter [Terrilactibacillus laevilacticus]